MIREIKLENGNHIVSLDSGCVIRSESKQVRTYPVGRGDIFEIGNSHFSDLLSPEFFINNDIVVSWDYDENRPIVKVIRKETWNNNLFNNTEIDKRRRIK